MLDFKGKNVLITGGSRGIGRATALAFAELGANVAIACRANAVAANMVTHHIERHGVRSLMLQAESTNEAALAEFVTRIAHEWGSLDVAVANAGIWSGVPIERMTVQEFREMMDINMTGSFLLSKIAAQQMIRQKSGAIVIVSSTAGQRGESGHSHYAASKGAQISFTKSLAVELAPHGVRVNSVAPGWVSTDMTSEALEVDRVQIERAIPLGRVAKPEEIANAVVFLSSDMSSAITGEILNVNGGSVLCG
ncbi:MAG: SDR family NAD(P)-dependent oxidoreductase [Bacteroidota bacterium]|nr:SDR family NAD(P)-dependent oxidoreductase [Bacteroidota bacterium]MDP4231841.1 SDR family NAD(P)-dependent oxidoreductase [Bacteroidota bacterium]MDP4242727.1 SDR family NAD(P)-dependent oxidoreductase [Bacteroidota bacterium]MDP4287178.1 SDR family NAD(P)-dependent oxidoreductase [Bacteroidota bacterium]